MIAAMKQRLPVLSGIVTLVTLVLSLAGSAWASSACTSEMDMSAPVQATQHGAATGRECMPGPAGHRSEAPTNAPPCPFGTAGTTASCACVSLPASAQLQIAPSPEAALALVTTGEEPHLLLGTTLFHPPKA